ncbi:RNA-binding protein [archaeon CG10_big_fil_rev_8_21_14_0_10_43_11]|nr:MAG: RNA-binding protein [archaeon CG10_big_fil_rev_8_21_14_0_10_43_11]
MEKNVCDNCSRDLLVSGDSVQFKCPKCLAHVIKRCGKCRSNAVKYTCASCGFSGP